ncbi:DUF4267 domain-containing protein [Mycolicibacterium sp. P1-18]|uniref:DUF4267 domain-containing protein n=1 Tax=Mycolicibacterium sp. P1-18 TaxID=2024615 RepID=UPI0011F39C3E|nr:DUF4267 domain-containing protein [Mycolicibacterium sp. P1-18]KAA0099547.1 DUF4267 domain-containing protein [Mycolicibacterium sp. P1-18]
MTVTTTIGYVLAGVLAAAIIFLGARFVLAPRVAAAGYGVPVDADQSATRAYLSVKGVRDIASGLIVIVSMIAGDAHLLGWIILAATVIPLGDAAIVLRSGGAKSIAYGVHGATAAVMLVTTALLLLS